MRENTAEWHLITWESLGPKAIDRGHFIGYSISRNHPSTGATNPVSQPEICSNIYLRIVQTLWNAEMWKSAHLSNSKIKLNELTSILTKISFLLHSQMATRGLDWTCTVHTEKKMKLWEGFLFSLTLPASINYFLFFSFKPKPHNKANDLHCTNLFQRYSTSQESMQ